MENDLKPCPVCGEEAILLKDEERYYKYQVACCNCRIEIVEEHDSTIAISAWNRWANNEPSK